MLFVHESIIDAPPAAVFAIHETPDALRTLIPPWETVEIVEGGGSIRPGSRVVLKVGVGPFRVRWVARHTDEFEPGRLFTDVQESGPFASWTHRHQFLDDGRGGTLLRDEVDYELPFGWLGRRLGDGLVRRKLKTMFEYRHETTRRLVAMGQTPGGGGFGPKLRCSSVDGG